MKTKTFEITNENGRFYLNKSNNIRRFDFEEIETCENVGQIKDLFFYCDEDDGKCLSEIYDFEKNHNCQLFVVEFLGDCPADKYVYCKITIYYRYEYMKTTIEIAVRKNESLEDFQDRILDTEFPNGEYADLDELEIYYFLAWSPKNKIIKWTENDCEMDKFDDIMQALKKLYYKYNSELADLCNGL